MSNSLILETLAAVDREVLIGLPFLRPEQRRLWKNDPSVSSRVIATVLCQRFPSETAALFAQAKAASEADARRRSVAVGASASHAATAAQTRAHEAQRADQQRELDAKFGLLPASGVVRYDASKSIQTFGGG